LINVEISPLIVELRGQVREHLVQGLSFVFNSALASIASESSNSVSVRCNGNVFSFLGNMLTLFLASGCSGKTLIVPLPGNGRLLFSDFNIPAFRHCLPSVAQQWSLTSCCLTMDVL
jgi:hypothetical protein